MLYEKIRHVKSPIRKTIGSGGIDFFIPNDWEHTSYKLMPQKGIVIPSGIKPIVQTGTILTAFNKSGVSTKRLIIKTAEMIDSDFRGEMHIAVVNVGAEPITIARGDQLVQFAELPVLINPVQEITSDTYTYLQQPTDRDTSGLSSDVANKHNYQ
jgi:dUTP pyrophosphatase